MNKKPVEPDEMRMPADEFDGIMRHALDAPPPSEEPKAKPKPKVVKGKKEPRA